MRSEREVRGRTKHLCMDEKYAVNFLEKVSEAKDIINKLTGIAQTDEAYKPLSKAYRELDKLLSPICPKCKVRAKRFITSPAQLYDPAMAEVEPMAAVSRWDGEWYCPKCRHLVAVGEKWWVLGREAG